MITGVCTTVPEAMADLRRRSTRCVPLAAERGLGLMCAGTHPITDWQTQQISHDAALRSKLIDDMQWLARRMQIFGVHVHVGVRSPDKAIAIVNALSAYIPHFLALSASSPYWVGADTGLASARSKVFEGLPTAGLPHQLAGWAQFESYMETLIKTAHHLLHQGGVVGHPAAPDLRHGRAAHRRRPADASPRSAMVAALSQCLVDTLDREIDKGYTLPRPRRWVVQENKWRAARYGLDADIIVGEDERAARCARRCASWCRTCARARRAARLHRAELDLVEQVLEGGASYAAAARRRGRAAAAT